MLGYDWPRFHAAVNDLPAALLFVTVLFDIAAWLTKRDSLKSAALPWVFSPRCSRGSCSAAPN